MIYRLRKYENWPKLSLELLNHKRYFWCEFSQQLHCHLKVPSKSSHWLTEHGLIWLSSVLRPLQHSIGYTGDGFYRSKDPTNSIKVLKEHTDYRTQNTANPRQIWGDYGMAPTEGRVTRPERRWGCHRGTPTMQSKHINHCCPICFVTCIWHL